LHFLLYIWSSIYTTPYWF